MNERGLGSDQAYHKLVTESKIILRQWETQQKSESNNSHDPGTLSYFLCKRQFVFAALSLVLMLIGAVDSNNNISLILFLFYSALLAYLILLYFWQEKVKNRLEFFSFYKAVALLESFDLESSKTFIYQKTVEPTTDDFSTCQTTIRDGDLCEVPKCLLVTGDIILLRPGQAAPCECTTINGECMKEGEKLQRQIEVDGSSAVQPLAPIKAIVTRTAFIEHLLRVVRRRRRVLDHDWYVAHLFHEVDETLVPAVFAIGLFVSIFRFFYSTDDDFYGTRFVFGIPALTVFPLLMLSSPLLFFFVRSENNRTVKRMLRIDEDTDVDLVATLASITETAIVDKKGVLSSTQPSIDKIVFGSRIAEYNEDENSEQKLKLGLEAIDVGIEEDRLAFEDPNWAIHKKNLLPIGLNVLMNSCRQTEEFNLFLDHLNVASTEVPRTIATANKRCMCELPSLLGFIPTAMDQFEGQVNTIGFYKRQPGEPPVPGLTRHKTPLEMAFCTVHTDNRALHLHLSCQGTANLVIEACSHIWDGDVITPLTSQLISSIRDLYHRHSMTGHCLALSYRPIFATLGRKLTGKFIELPLNHPVKTAGRGLPRTHSRDDVADEQVISRRVIEEVDDLIEEYFTGHVFSGLAVLQYEALPMAVELVESLYNICVRPVYFSKENELRSRVFAEKLGMEAGWNCHISLEEEEKKSFFFGREKFVKQAPNRKGRKAISQTTMTGDEFENLRSSPIYRRTSLLSEKVAPLENKARLPAGIANVRPHLDEVDNVPLLVGLFTDATTDSVEEMLDIMAENGEAVIVIGSSRNLNNTRLFKMASLSACIDPTSELSCRMENPISPVKSTNELHANRVASQLISISADFRLTHDSLPFLTEAIEGSRNRMVTIKATMTFFLLSSILVSTTVASSVVLFLPLIFTHAQVALTSLVHIPLLMMSIIFNEFEEKNDVVRIAPKVIEGVQKVEKTKLLTTFLVHFLPSAAYILVLFSFMLLIDTNILCTPPELVCDILQYDTWQNSTVNSEATHHVIRHVCATQFTLLLCAISVSYVHTLSSSLLRSLKSIKWALAVALIVTSQTLFSAASDISPTQLLPTIPTIVLVVWITVLLILNEVFKKHRIRQYSREQRRTKFNFDTKLGMNSPY